MFWALITHNDTDIGRLCSVKIFVWGNYTLQGVKVGAKLYLNTLVGY
jgi:hypothetical protein